MPSRAQAPCHTAQHNKTAWSNLFLWLQREKQLRAVALVSSCVLTTPRRKPQAGKVCPDALTSASARGGPQPRL